MNSSPTPLNDRQRRICELILSQNGSANRDGIWHNLKHLFTNQEDLSRELRALILGNVVSKQYNAYWIKKDTNLSTLVIDANQPKPEVSESQTNQTDGTQKADSTVESEQIPAVKLEFNINKLHNRNTISGRLAYNVFHRNPEWVMFDDLLLMLTPDKRDPASVLRVMVNLCATSMVLKRGRGEGREYRWAGTMDYPFHTILESDKGLLSQHLLMYGQDSLKPSKPVVNRKVEPAAEQTVESSEKTFNTTAQYKIKPHVVAIHTEISSKGEKTTVFIDGHEWVRKDQ